MAKKKTMGLDEKIVKLKSAVVALGRAIHAIEAPPVAPAPDDADLETLHEYFQAAEIEHLQVPSVLRDISCKLDVQHAEQLRDLGAAFERRSAAAARQRRAIEQTQMEKGEGDHSAVQGVEA